MGRYLVLSRLQRRRLVEVLVTFLVGCSGNGNDSGASSSVDPDAGTLSDSSSSFGDASDGSMGGQGAGASGGASNGGTSLAGDASDVLDSAVTDASGDSALTDASGDSPGDASGDVLSDSASSDSGGGSTEFECVPAAPPGWTVIAYYFAEPDPPACPPTFPFVKTAGGVTPSGSPVECTSCSCASPVGTNCAQSFVRNYSDSACSQAIGSRGGDACMNASSGTSHRVSVPGNFTCEPTGGDVSSRPAVDWGTNALLCDTYALEQSSCDFGEVLSPVAPAPFEAQACITIPGDLACPVGPYQSRQVVYEAVDERACSSCSCGDSVGVCSFDWVRYDSFASCSDASCCTGNVVDSGSGEACWIEAGPGSVLFSNISPTGGGSCPPLGGDSSGVVQQGTETTICCR